MLKYMDVNDFWLLGTCFHEKFYKVLFLNIRIISTINDFDNIFLHTPICGHELYQKNLR